MPGENFTGGRPTYDVEELALWSDRELPEDSRDEADAITAWPEGVSTMPFSDTADWDGNATAGTVVTERTVNGGGQIAYFAGGWIEYRPWDNDGVSWGFWRSYANASHVHQNIVPVGDDAHAEADPITDWPDGDSNMRASAAANWDGYGAVATVTTHRTGDVGWQEFVLPYYGTDHHQWRTYDVDGQGGWSPWEYTFLRGTFLGHTHDAADIDGGTLDDARIPSGIARDSEVAAGYTPLSHVGSGGGAHASANGSTAGFESAAHYNKVEGIEASATADQTAAEILAALLTVDGAASGLDADKVDGNEASAFVLTTQKGAANGVCELDSSSLIPTSRIPALAISELDSVASQAAMLALSAEPGDLAIRTDFDPDRVYMLTATDPSVLANWTRVTFGDVVSVNGQVGVIVLGAADVGAYTTAQVDTLLAGKADDAEVTAAAILTAIKTVDGSGSLLDADLVDGQHASAFAAATHGSGHAWNGADAVRPTVRALQTIGAAGAIAVGSDWIILVTATADRTGITVDAGAFDGQFIQIANRSAFSLTFNATEATSRVVGGGAIAPASRSLLMWDANYGGVGTGRWVKLPADAAAAIASLRTLGTGATQAAAGNDTRLSDTRTPTDSSVTDAKVAAAAAIAESKLNLASDAAAGTASRRTLGTGATQAAAGNDSRLTDARAPTTREWSCVWYEPDLSLLAAIPYQGVGKQAVPNSGTPTITEVCIIVDTLPTGASIIVDLNSVNDTTNARTSLYTNQGNRPTITTSAPYKVFAALPDTLTPGVGAQLGIDVDQRGSGTAGKGMTVIVRGTY